MASLIHLHYLLSDKGRRAAILAGRLGLAEGHIQADIADLPCDVSEALIAIADIGADGVASVTETVQGSVWDPAAGRHRGVRIDADGQSAISLGLHSRPFDSPPSVLAFIAEAQRRRKALESRHALAGQLASEAEATVVATGVEGLVETDPIGRACRRALPRLISLTPRLEALLQEASKRVDDHNAARDAAKKDEKAKTVAALRVACDRYFPDLIAAYDAGQLDETEIFDALESDLGRALAPHLGDTASGERHAVSCGLPANPLRGWLIAQPRILAIVEDFARSLLGPNAACSMTPGSYQRVVDETEETYEVDFAVRLAGVDLYYAWSYSPA